MFRKKVLSFSILILLILSGCGNSSMTKTYSLKNILDNGNLVLSGNKTVNLVGVKLSGEKSIAGFKDYLKDLVGDNRLIIIPDTLLGEKDKVVYAYVYLWGKNDINKKELSGIEKRGFVDVQGFLGAEKGLAVLLNTYLIRTGYAKVDTAKDFDYKKEFLDLESAVKNK